MYLINLYLVEWILRGSGFHWNPISVTVDPDAMITINLFDGKKKLYRVTFFCLDGN